MKLMTFFHEGKEKYGVVTNEENTVWDIMKISRQSQISCPENLLTGITAGKSFIQTLKDLIAWANQDSKAYQIPIDKIKCLPPIPKPRKNIMCVGKNYREHAIEMGSVKDIPEHLMVFTKAPTTVIGHLQEVDLHSNMTKQLDYEGELAIVMGKEGKNIPKESALDYVFGYTILNDITARDLQQQHKQFFIGKSLDSSCPIGPWIVLNEHISDPGKLNISTTVNGEVRQQANTSQFIFPIEEIISVLSQGMTLEPGDIIATGTPAGVGKGFHPPKFLQSGDCIEISIQGIGKLNNIVK